MLKNLLLGTALGAIVASGALAQSPIPPLKSTPAPAAQAQSSGQVSGSANVIASQKPDQWLASKFRGTDVLGSDNQKIGDISDILFDKSGKIEAFVVSVGGILGVGAKEVALAPIAVDLVPGTNGSADKFKVSMSKDQLKEAQNFTPYQPPRATTGMAPGGGLTGGTRPYGMNPPSNTPPTEK